MTSTKSKIKKKKMTIRFEGENWAAITFWKESKDTIYRVLHDIGQDSIGSDWSSRSHKDTHPTDTSDYVKIHYSYYGLVGSHEAKSNVIGSDIDKGCNDYFDKILYPFIHKDRLQAWINLYVNTYNEMTIITKEESMSSL